jgi:NADPH:quinone reductase-like Zn-dependent oxidoreductase
VPTVFTTAGSDDKTEFCRSVGADHAINYRTQDFVAEIARITGKSGVDVVLDMVGGDYIEKNLKCLALEGRLVMIAFLHGGTRRGRLAAHHDAALDRHGLDTQSEPDGAQNRAGEGAARQRVAARRGAESEDRDPTRLSAGGGRGRTLH